MSELLCQSYSQNKQVKFWITKLCRFPFVLDKELMNVLYNLNLNAWPQDAVKKLEENKLILSSSIYIQKYNEWLCLKNYDSFTDLFKMFSEVVLIWKKVEEKKKKDELEKESLYATK